MQTAIVQCKGGDGPVSLPLAVSAVEPLPTLTLPDHVLVRVLAVALNPNDHKMVTHFPMPGYGTGCDFCGIIEWVNEDQGLDDVVPPHQIGARVCGTVFPYAPVDAQEKQHRIGAFSEHIVVDRRLLLRVPENWSDLQGAALGGVGWSTVGLAMSSPDALALAGLPSKPSKKKMPVLVYGGGTATGTMACQLLKRSGYVPIAVTHSEMSANLAEHYGAANVVTCTDADATKCLDKISTIVADGPPLRHALDCITDADSASFCFKALARTGGRYACLEEFRGAWRTRRVVKVKEVMGYEVLGRQISLGGQGSIYTRGINHAAVEVGRCWSGEMQSLLDGGLVETHPVQEVQEWDVGGQWADAVIVGLQQLKAGGVRGQKLGVRVSRSDASAGPTACDVRPS